MIKKKIKEKDRLFNAAAQWSTRHIYSSTVIYDAYIQQHSDLRGIYTAAQWSTRHIYSSTVIYEAYIQQHSDLRGIYIEVYIFRQNFDFGFTIIKTDTFCSSVLYYLKLLPRISFNLIFSYIYRGRRGKKLDFYVRTKNVIFLTIYRFRKEHTNIIIFCFINKYFFLYKHKMNTFHELVNQEIIFIEKEFYLHTFTWWTNIIT